MPEAMALALVVMVFIPTIAWVCDRAASRVASARAEERKRSEEERAMLGRQRSGVLDMREKWIAQRESVVWDREKQLARQVSGAQSEVVERALGMASALADPKVVMRRDRTSASPSRVTEANMLAEFHNETAEFMRSGKGGIPSVSHLASPPVPTVEINPPWRGEENDETNYGSQEYET